MTAQHVTLAARWLRARAQAVAVARVDIERQRRQARARTARQPRDTHGRWCRQERRAA
jgi:hypothetical protein